MQKRVIALLSTVLISYTADAQDSVFELKIHGLADVRAVHSSDQLSWLDRGLSKLRYGTNIAGSNDHLNLAEVSLVAEAQFTWSLSAMAHFKYDPEQRNTVDMVEAFVRYDPASTSSWRLRGRAGMFYPPISLEHTDIAWTSPYSLTPSAINSWVGEEVKATGVEMTLEKRAEQDIYSLTGSAFMLNDPTGSLLAWRGWAFHDIKTTAFGRFPLPNLTSFNTVLSLQAPWVEPHHEIDNRVGFYAATNWTRRGVASLSALYFTNRGDPLSFNGTQYGWDTEFFNLGATIELPDEIELLAQFMRGNSKMGPKNNDMHLLDFNFSSYYLLLSKMIGEQRVSLRYDNYNVDDRSYIQMDNNNEDGHAWMASISRTFKNRHRFMFEALRVTSDRASRVDLLTPTRAKENQIQLSYRFAF